MYQIDNATAVGSPPASTSLGTPGYFTDGDLMGGIDPTILPAEYMNAMMRELLNLVSAAGISPSKSQFNQILLAVESLIESRGGNYVVDTGTANAYVVALSPPITSYQNGTSIRFRAVHGNTTACTLNAGGGVEPLVRDDGSALQIGDIPANGIVSCTYDLATTSFVLNSVVPSQLGQTYAGNPNGNVAGNAPATGGVIQSTLWDTVNKILWMCTTSGNAASAVWTQIGSSGSLPAWCGTSTGSANAQVVAVPSAMQSFAAGSAIAWLVGGGLTNTGATTIQIGAFGTFSLRKDGPAGPVALSGGELVAGNMASGRFDGTFLQLTATEMGTAALANASSGTGTVAAVSGTFTVGNLAVAADTIGTLRDGGIPGAAAAPLPITGPATLGPGVYAIDTSAGGFTITFAASPAAGASITLIDPYLTWGINPPIVAPSGGNTVVGIASNLPLNLAGATQMFNFKTNNWEPQ